MTDPDSILDDRDAAGAFRAGEIALGEGDKETARAAAKAALVALGEDD